MASRGRSRRVFVAVVITVALVAVLGGALLAYLIFVDEPRPRTVVAAPPAPPKPVEAFVAEPLEPWSTASTPREPRPRPQPRPARPRPRPAELDDAAISSGLGRLQASFDQCAREHGAVEGSLVRVGFSVSADGGVEDPFALAPHGRTPLGRCIVDALARARLRRTEHGRRDVRWSLHLHP